MQLALPLERRRSRRGGKRKDAGRKPNGVEAGASHGPREHIERALPVHITVRMAPHVYNLRSRRSFSVIGRAIAKAADRFGMMKRRGRVLADRYHAHVLRNPTEARRVVLYVRNNFAKHMAEIGKPVGPNFVDPFASTGANIELAMPRMWLLRRAVAPP